MYNPSDVGKRGKLFGLPYSLQQSDLIIVPVNLDVTVSYGEGTSRAPELILNESGQLDLSIPNVRNPWQLKLSMDSLPFPNEENDQYRDTAKKIINGLESSQKHPDHDDLLTDVNSYCEKIHLGIEERCDELLNKNKLVGILGGDHSVALGLMRSLAKKKEFGILQIDAHMDLRNAYEGFTYSHASVMSNALDLDRVLCLTQIGIRDYCDEEERYVGDSAKEIRIFFDEVMFSERMQGKRWSEQVKNIIQTLPESVYISFDIDGLDPSLCPNTGTPVPGGLTFNEAIYLVDELVRSGRKIVGFDLCEVGNAIWDANVGARILYRLAVATGVSQHLLQTR